MNNREGEMDSKTHRRRLRNLLDVHRITRACLREHAIGEYLAGQVTYNLGEYPAPLSLAPMEYDHSLLKELSEHGVTLIQIHEEWNDSQRCLGADKLTSHDPEGLREFVDLVHSLGMKVILYASTGFFEASDPDFKPEWAIHPNTHLVEMYFDYALCSPASPEWRAYILPRLERLMDEYGLDGLYDDLGYTALYQHQPMPPTHISLSEETPEHDAALEDLLGLVMNLVHKRGGILKIHYGAATAPACTRKVYDYLWVGESVEDLDNLRVKVKSISPYVVPCPDMSRAVIEREDDFYLHFVPYMQFPLRVDGRPFTGERSAVKGMNYRRGEECFWTRHFRTAWRHYQAYPDAPPMYGCWDSFPGRPEARALWLHHFDLYRPMVKEGTYVWVEIKDTKLFKGINTDELTASLFVNDEVYLVLANYGRTASEITSGWTWQDRETGRVSKILRIPPRKVLYFQRVEEQESVVSINEGEVSEKVLF